MQLQAHSKCKEGGQCLVLGGGGHRGDHAGAGLCAQRQVGRSNFPQIIQRLRHQPCPLDPQLQQLRGLLQPVNMHHCSELGAPLL